MATTGRDSGRSSVKELYSTKAKCVVNPDFILDHYNLSGSVGNFDVDGAIPAQGQAGADNPKQAPFSKRFQIIRALDGNQTTTG